MQKHTHTHMHTRTDSDEYATELCVFQSVAKRNRGKITGHQSLPACPVPVNMSTGHEW